MKRYSKFLSKLVIISTLTLGIPGTAFSSTSLSTNSSLNQQLAIAKQAMNNGQFDIAYRKALSIKESAVIENRQDILADTLYSIGKTFYYLSDFESALNYYHQALKIYEHIDSTNNVASTLSNIGNTHIELEQFSIAFDFHNRAYHLSKHLSVETKLKVLLNYGYILHRINNQEESEDIFKELSNAFTKNPDSIQRIYFYLMKAEIDRDNNKLDSSFAMIEQAASLAKKHYREDLLIAAQIEQVDSLIKAQQSNKAVSFGLTLIDPVKQLNREDKLELLYQHLYQAYKAINTHDKALIYFELYHQIRAQRQAIKEKQFANILSIDRKLEDARKAIKQEQTNVKLTERKYQLEIRKLLLWYSIAIGLMLILIGYLIYKLLRIRNRH